MNIASFPSPFKIFSLIILSQSLNAQMYFETKFKTPFEKSGGIRTATYEEIIYHYKTLDETYDQAKLISLGPSDAGDPLHLFLVSQDMVFDARHPSRRKKTVVMIMNGIHSGESDGIDASMMYFDVILKAQAERKEFKDLIFLVIPVYNVGGAKNQAPFRRANQSGPENLGSRGNAKNLDLNRDFIKADSRNTLLFQKAFNDWKPELFLDIHVSNGADYSYTNTLLSTTADKLSKGQSELLTEKLEPYLFSKMKKAGYEMTPYVNVFNADPKDGYSFFFDSPRYSTGFAALHHTIGFMLENHMLKPYKDRVYSTFEFLLDFGTMALKYADDLKEKREEALSHYSQNEYLPIRWKLDENRKQKQKFKGYERVPKISSVTADTIWTFDREKPYTEEIDVWKNFNVLDSVKKPYAYIIPYAYENIVQKLKANKIMVENLGPDKKFQTKSMSIKDLESSRRLNGGHYIHQSFDIDYEDFEYKSGPRDFLVRTDQEGIRFIIETLEPKAHDSYFRWNFFDGVLQGHEWFSTYVFDDYASSLLEKNPELRKEFKKRKKEEPDFAKSQFAQYYFLFNKSPYREPELNRYPIYRIEAESDLN